MAKRGRKPLKPYVTQWSEVIPGVRPRIMERDTSGEPVVWHLYPTGKSVPYFGAVRKGDLASERKAIGHYLRWKAEQEGTPWEKHEGNTPYGDAVMVGLTYIGERDRGKKRGQTTSEFAIQEIVDRRVAKLSSKYAEKYREFIRDLILTNPRRAAAELGIDQLAWLQDVKPPPPSISLSDIGEMYSRRPLQSSDHWNRKMRRIWQEFIKLVGATFIRDITRESMIRYRDAIYKKQKEGKSRTFVAHRFGGVKAVLRYARSEVERPEEISRVVDLCAVFKLPRKERVSPKPIKPEHFRKLLDAVGDEPKWKAMFLLALNAAMYPSEVAAVKRPDIYLRNDKYLDGKKPDAKAWHHRGRRVGLQESCPQSNFRRVIASLVPNGEFCNHKINYFPESDSRFRLEVLLGLLNSKLTDWYFRLGSTNASVSHYQRYILPAPAFEDDPSDERLVSRFDEAVEAGRQDEVFALVAPLLRQRNTAQHERRQMRREAGAA